MTALARSAEWSVTLTARGDAIPMLLRIAAIVEAAHLRRNTEFVMEQHRVAARPTHDDVRAMVEYGSTDDRL